MAEFVTGQLVFSKQDNAEVTIVTVHSSGAFVSGASRVNEWRGLSTLTPLEPRVGDRVRVVEIHPGDLSPQFVVGDEFELNRSNACRETGNIGYFAFMATGQDERTIGKLVLIRRASPPAEVKERRCYGSRPSELPKTLPAGTKWKKAKEGYGREGVFTHAAQLGVGFYVGHGHEFEGGDPVERHVAAERIDWSTVEIQPAPASAGEAVAAGWVPAVGDRVRCRLDAKCAEEFRGLCGVVLKVYGDHADVRYDVSPHGRDHWSPLISFIEPEPISPPSAGSALNGDAQASASAPVGGGSSTKGSCPHCAQHGCLETSRPCVNCGTQVTCQNVLRDFADGWLCASRACREVSIYHDMLDIDRKRKEGVGTVANPDALDRLAASRKLAQTKEAMDRPAVERHPREWPEGAGDEQELYVS